MSRSPVRRERFTSADGTALAVTVTGDGPPLVVAPGSLATARDWALVARALAPRMTTWVLDRRGHGDSGDGPSFSLEREQEDLAAVTDLAGGDVTLLGHSYGAVIALGLAVYEPPPKLVLYEPPLPLDGPLGGPLGGAVLDAYAAAVEAGDNDRALALGLREFVGMTGEAVAILRGQPIWARLAGMAPSWTREIRAIDEFGGDLGRFAALNVPVLLLTGEQSPAWLVKVSRRLAAALPDARLASLPGQAHDAHIFDAQAVAREIASFALTLGTPPPGTETSDA